MKLFIGTCLFIVITSFCTTRVMCQDNKDSDDDDVEEEWRLLEKDETVPRGSHVQIDLTTRERRIKVVGKTRPEEKHSLVAVEKQEEGGDTPDHLQKRLHKIYGDDPIDSYDEDSKIRQKYRTYEELKKDFEELQMAVKTDIEIMNGIVESYKELVDDKFQTNVDVQDQQVSMLLDLEYLLHQIDNANEFVGGGGLTNIVLPSLNSTSPEVRTSTARVLGSAARSNTAVQIAALEAGAIGVLLRIIALDGTPSVRSSSLYALSCLVRRFPVAQKKFVDEGGLTVLKNLYDSNAGDKLKIQVKVVTFIHDLIVEKHDAERVLSAAETVEAGGGNGSSGGGNGSAEEARERVRQYSAIGLETRLQEQLWCRQLSGLLAQQVSHHLDKMLAGVEASRVAPDLGPEHDVVEKVVGAMISSAGLCLGDLKGDAELRTVLRILDGWYRRLADAEDEASDDYFVSLAKLVERLAFKLDMKLHEQQVHDEL